MSKNKNDDKNANIAIRENDKIEELEFLLNRKESEKIVKNIKTKLSTDNNYTTNK